MYPLILNLEGKKCLVVGNGKVASRKIAQLQKAKALVKIISPDLNKSFDDTDIEPGTYLVFAATNNPEVNLQVYTQCQKMGIFCQMVHAGKKSDFMVPAVLRRGKVIVSVSTSGTDPKLAMKIREKIATLDFNDDK